jgi:hypothetical protein
LGKVDFNAENMASLRRERMQGANRTISGDGETLLRQRYFTD